MFDSRFRLHNARPSFAWGHGSGGAAVAARQWRHVAAAAAVAEVAETAERDMGERHGGETLGRGMRERDEGER